MRLAREALPEQSVEPDIGFDIALLHCDDDGGGFSFAIRIPTTYLTTYVPT